MRALQDQLAPQGITFRQAQVLAWIVLKGPQSQAELASRMSIEPPSLVGTLDRMEAGGLIERRPCSSDRRKKLVHLLEASEAIWERVADVARKIRNVASRGLNEQEVAELKRLLKKITDNVKQQPQ